MKKVSMTVYKYYTVNDQFLHSLKNNYLWFSKPSAFNDPFDCYECLMTFNPSEKDLEELLMGEVSRKAILADPNSLSEYLQNKVRAIFETYGVCCFSLVPDNLLLWSHYANKHKGVCLCFETENDPATFNGYLVNYKEHFETVNYFTSHQKAFTNLLMTKSICWQYEREYRLFRESSGPVTYAPASLKAIIYGWKTPMEERQRIREALFDSEKVHQKNFMRATPKSDSFGLEIKPN